jgi:hypothetical protein
MLTAHLHPAKTFTEARNLVARFRNAEGFRAYLLARRTLIVPAGAVFILIAMACAAAVVLFLADRHPLLALPELVLAPFVLIGSLFVQSFVFLSWLESRAIAQVLRRPVRNVPVPWVLAGVFLVLPLALLGSVAPKAALVAVLAGVAVPFAFARLDRR